MDVQRMIEALNKCLALEYAGVIQYYQHSFLLQGPEREYLAGFFRNMAKKCLEHVQRLGEKIVALGGLPTVEPGTIRQASDVQEMLRQALELERGAQAAHHAALQPLSEKNEASEEIALRVMLEELVEEEQDHIEEVEMLLGTKRPTVTEKQVRLKQSR